MNKGRKVFLWSLGIEGRGRVLGIIDREWSIQEGLHYRPVLKLLALFFFFSANFHMLDSEIDSPRSMWKISRNAR